MTPPLLASPQNPTASQGNNKAADLEKRAEHVDTLEWLGRLKENKDFARFLEFVKSGASVYLDQSKDIDRKTPEQRLAYFERFYAVNFIANYTEQKLAEIHATIKAIDDRLRKV